MDTKYLLFVILLLGGRSIAQSQELTATDKKEIQSQARIVVEEKLLDLLNNLTLLNISDQQRQNAMLDSYSQSLTQIFAGRNVLIADDINPKNIVKMKGPDQNIASYLKDLSDYYTKSSRPTIRITEVVVGEIVQDSLANINVTFKIHRSNIHSIQKTKYPSVYRKAVLRADKPDRQWIVRISGINYYTPDVKNPVSEALAVNSTTNTSLKKEDEKSKEVKIDNLKNTDDSKAYSGATLIAVKPEETVKEEKIKSQPAEPVKTQQTIITSNQPEKLDDKPAPVTPTKPAEGSAAVAQKKKLVSPNAVEALEKKVSKFKTQTALYRALSIGSMAGAAATFFIVNSSYSKYKSELTENNSRLNSWWNAAADQSTNGENFGSIENYQAKPESLLKFGSPGIYFAGVGILAGGVFWLMSNKPNSEAKRYKKLLDQRRKPVSMAPQWDATNKYAGLYLRITF